MTMTRRLLLPTALSFLILSACGGPPPMARPEAFTPLGLDATYLTSDVIGGYLSRSARMRAAKIAPAPRGAAPALMASLEGELRRQTAGMGLDVLRVGNGIVIRIPASLTFDSNSANVRPQFDASLREIARTVRTRNATFVDVFAHSDLSGSDKLNLSLSDKRAAAVAAYLARHGVAKARIASKGFGRSMPLHNPELTESDKAANRRVEIRLAPYIG
jgi:outer membrane protein OmpA-like peptidoglycan-associated protein